ncbi:hypothetical protein KIPB_016835, partial [Kipferlia bialata]|eukprot:g16835.t1
MDVLDAMDEATKEGLFAMRPHQLDFMFELDKIPKLKPGILI